MIPRIIHPAPPEFQPTFAPNTHLEDIPVHVYVTDEELIRSLGLSGQMSIREEQKPIFSGEPTPVDVQQIDRRSTCYLMSMLASYAAMPSGKKILEAMVRPAGENLALVTFYDPLIRENIQVMVSTARLVDEQGKDLYSFGNPTDARWAGIIEKGYHAYKLSRSNTVRSEIENAQQAGDKPKVNYLVDQLHKVAPLDPRRSLIDWGDPLQSVSCLPELPEIKDRARSQYTYQPDTPKKLHEFDLKDEKAINELRYNIEMGVPVTLGTPGATLKGVFRAATTGTPTNHAIAVLGPATSMRKGKVFEGVLVYDQYGSLVDGVPGVSSGPGVTRLVKTPAQMTSSLPPVKTTESVAPRSEASGSDSDPIQDFDIVTEKVVTPVQIKAAGRSVRFYRYEELHKYFVKGTLARGFYS